MQELIQAIDLALANEWNQAHSMVQKIENKSAYWIHAVLHKIEGDQGNSGYWYTRAGKVDHSSMDSTEELQLIRQGLVSESK